MNWSGSPRFYSARADTTPEQLAFDKREAAYRANNLGVASLEQYKAKEAVESFTRALEIKPDLLIARINLSIALLNFCLMILNLKTDDGFELICIGGKIF